MSVAFAGRTVLVTGGAGGIGGAIARRLAQEDASVVIIDVDDAGRRVAAECDGSFVAADLADPVRAARAVADEVGELDGLVNAAGIHELSRFPDLDPDEWHRVLDINAAAPLFLTQALVDHIPHGGAVVNVTSLEEHVPVASIGPMTPIYAASKAALGLITTSLAPALGARGIRINAVAPGFVHTPLSAPVRDLAEPWSAASTPARRWAQPDEIADAVLFLLSDDARYVTGVSLRVDGGFSLGPQRVLEPIA